MNCIWQDIPDSVDDRGWRKTVCLRCRHETALWPIEHVHYRECTGRPFAHEYREWLAIFSTAAGVTEALAICQYIRWRAKGSKLEELPPGVPSPNVLPIPAPTEGPGTEIEKILSAAGASSDVCGGLCAQHRDEMNRWGAEGCKARRAEIVAWLKEAAYKTWIMEQIKIGWALSREPWFRFDDPVGCIVDEAIRRSELLSSAERG